MNHARASVIVGALLLPCRRPMKIESNEAIMQQITTNPILVTECSSERQLDALHARQIRTWTVCRHLFLLAHIGNNVALTSTDKI
jgi:hypothetical protein